MRRIKQVLSIFVSVVLTGNILTGIPGNVNADDNDSDGDPEAAVYETVTYVDLKGKNKTAEALVMTGSEAKLEEAWYAVTEDVSYDNRITIDGDVNIILCDDATLTPNKGIGVDAGNSLTIWGQAGSTGTIGNAPNIESHNAYIGGTGTDSGLITINGGSISGNGGFNSASIGGGHEGTGNVVINNGTVNVRGGVQGAGIGGGGGTSESKISYITINGGTVTTTGGKLGAGIGGGGDNTNADITITGGTVNATGGQSAPGIGAGSNGFGSGLATVNISGGNVTATGGFNSYGIGTATSYSSYMADITLSWTNETDSINAKSYKGDITLAKPFKSGDDIFAQGTVSADDIGGKTLVPYDGMGVRFAGHTLSLDGDIGVNFYMELDSSIASSQTAYMQFTLPSGSDQAVSKLYVKDAQTDTIGGKTYHVFKCNVSAKEMTSAIKAQLINGDDKSVVYSYSVKEYAGYILDHTGDSEAYAKAAPLVKAMLNFGAYSQIYFGFRTSDLANKDLSEADKDLGNVIISVEDPVITDCPTG